MTNKTDMERVGLFKELGYHTIGDPYKSNANIEFNKSACSGAQMLTMSTKSKTAHRDGYFDEFNRVYDSEAYTDLPKLRRQAKIQSNKKRLGKEWVPVSSMKDPSGLGSYYGTFSGVIPHFQAISKDQKQSVVKGKNFVTNPGKVGTGYGYIGLTMGKYPEYRGENYDANRKEIKREAEAHKSQVKGRSVFRLGMHGSEYFNSNPYQGPREKFRSVSADHKSKNNGQKIFRPSNPSKSDGGMKAGCFSNFPTYSSEPYNRKLKGPSTEKKFLPSAGPKTMPSNSILYQNVFKSINPSNYRNVQSVMSY